MLITIDDSQASGLDQIRALVAAHSAIRFAGERREEIYDWVGQTLVRHEYAGLAPSRSGGSSYHQLGIDYEFAV